MATRIPPDQVQNLQQLEAQISGPDGATRLLTVNGQFDMSLNVIGTANNFGQNTGVFSVLIGPVLTRQQFYKAIGTASLAKTQFNISATQAICGWTINNIDADWDDESGQVELRIEVSVQSYGLNNTSAINGLAFQGTILCSGVVQ